MAHIPPSAAPRILRAAFALKDGTAYLEWLKARAQRDALVAAAKSGLPSVAGISEGFRKKFGPTAGKDMVTRQFIGAVVKAIMHEDR